MPGKGKQPLRSRGNAKASGSPTAVALFAVVQPQSVAAKHHNSKKYLGAIRAVNPSCIEAGGPYAERLREIEELNPDETGRRSQRQDCRDQVDVADCEGTVLAIGRIA